MAIKIPKKIQNYHDENHDDIKLYQENSDRST